MDSGLKKRWIIAAVCIVIIAAAAIGGIGYWRYLRTTPQYSLALIVDAARRDDKADLDRLVDTGAVVDGFVPQVTEKAADIYARGMSQSIVRRIATVAQPLLPAIKGRARDELPKLIRKQTDRFSHLPFAGFVLGADRYLDIAVEGNIAIIRSKLPEHKFEFTMKRSGDVWQIVDVRDDELATRIAQAIGQEIIGIAASGELKRAGQTLGISNLQNLIKQAEEAIQQ